MNRTTALLAASIVAATTASAAPKDFVLTAKGALGQAQADAVQKAGGSIYYSHAGTGLVMARSEAADFATKVLASGAFSEALADMVVPWVPDGRTYDLDEAAINPTNDPLYPIQWAPRAIGAPAAWAAGCTGKGVRVAIIDGGIFSTHPDLAANIDSAASTSFVAGHPFNDDVGTFWHGTHVAGIVAAVDNATGVVGIAPEATIIGVKALHNGSGSFGAVIAGILYAATPRAAGGGGADIINMSLGASFLKNDPDNRGLVAAMNKAVNYADRFGVLVVSAAGNEGFDLDHSGNLISTPAESGSGIAIAATAPVGWATGVGADANNFSRLASYSNFGTSAIHVSAPGGDFAYPGNENCTIVATRALLGLRHGAEHEPCWLYWAAGTSMAAPAASAVAALIKGKNPAISLGALKSRLAQSADDVYKPGADPFSGKGWVNAARACSAN